MGKVSNTWGLAKVSWGVLRADKELLLLPVVSAICTVLVSATFVVPFLVVPEMVSGGRQGPGPYVGLFLFYFVNYMVVIFFNTALIGAATIRLKGGDPTVGDGLRIAWENLGRIVQWAAVAATVGMVLRIIEERVGWLGKIIVGLLGAAWSVAVYFVVPVMVYEQLGPIESVKRSAELFRKTWGERLVSSISFGWLFFLLTLLVIPVIIGGAMLGSTALLAAILISVLYVLVLAVVSAALNGILVAAMYDYARSGKPAGPFTQQMMTSAWRPR